MINLTIVSTHRADWGHLEPLANAAKADPRYRVQVLDHAPTEDAPKDGHSVAFLQGDRTELLAVCGAAIHHGLLIAHAAGGEVTTGSTDQTVRDAISKLAHLHYPVHDDGRERLYILREDPTRICVVGEIGHDAEMVDGELPMDVQRGDLVVAYHPVTARPHETARGLNSINDMIRGMGHRRVWLTDPNGDPGSEEITRCWQQMAAQHPRCEILPNLGHVAFRTLIRQAGQVMGNSSAILTEAPMLGAYPILIGTRQEGRIHSDFKPGACAKILNHMASTIASHPDIRVKYPR